MAAPNEAELKALGEFRSVLASMKVQLPEYQDTDLGLLAWLRARELNVDAAVIMLRRSLDWRRANNIKNVLLWTPPSNYSSDFPYRFVGNDAEGRLVMILPFGLWNVRKVMDLGENEVWLRYTDFIFARMVRALRQTSENIQKEVTQVVLIVDCAQFTISQLASITSMEAIKECVRRFDSNYPEILYKALVVNSSRVFMMAYRIIKQFLAVRTASKIEIFSSPETWKPQLLKYVPAEVLPKLYGGLA